MPIERVVRIGDLALRAKVAVGTSAGAKDTVRSWTLFGDPSMALPASAFADPPPSTDDGSGTGSTSGSGGTTDSGSGGGFFSCGSIRMSGGGGEGGPMGPGSAAAAGEFALLALMILLFRRSVGRFSGYSPRSA